MCLHLNKGVCSEWFRYIYINIYIRYVQDLHYLYTMSGVETSYIIFNVLLIVCGGGGAKSNLFRLKLKITV